MTLATMKGDFSRDTFDPAQQITRVLLAQRRLIVDADWNEQSAIFLNYLRALASDIIGWHGGPNIGQKNAHEPDTGAFAIQLENNNNLTIVGNGGRYYVDGLLLEELKSRSGQTPIAPEIVNNNAPPTLNRLVYLDIWERHVTSLAEPMQPDPAFGGLETSTRVKLEFRAKILRTAKDNVFVKAIDKGDDFRNLKVQQGQAADDTTDPVIDSRPLDDQGLLPTLAAWTTPPPGKNEPCGSGNTTAASGYTGLENQLFRVEIHQGGKSLWTGDRTDDGTPTGKAVQTGGFPKVDPKIPPVTFKYSIDNGAIVYRVKDLSTGSTNSLTLAAAWRDESRAIKPQSWIEILDENQDAGTLVYVRDVKKKNGVVRITFTLQPDNPPKSAESYKPSFPDAKNGSVIVRRWDHHARKSFPQNQGGIVVQGVFKDDTWTSNDIPLQDGILIRLTLPKNAEFRPGDHWLIPARAATQNILFPAVENPQPARYLRHYYAPLAILDGQALFDLRKAISLATS